MMKLLLCKFVLPLWAIGPQTSFAKKVRGQKRRFLKPKSSKAPAEPYLTCGIKGAKCLGDGELCYEELESAELANAIDICGSCCNDSPVEYLYGRTWKYCRGFPDGFKCGEASGKGYSSPSLPYVCDSCINEVVTNRNFIYCGAIEDEAVCSQRTVGSTKSDYDKCDDCLNDPVYVIKTGYEYGYCGAVPEN